MNEIKRVLHVIPGFGGGISSHVRNIVNSIDTECLTIDVAGFTDYPQEFVNEVRAKGGDVHRLKNIRIKTLYKNIKEYKQILKSKKYCAVHLHLTDKQALYFASISKLFGIQRIIVHAHIADQEGSESIYAKIKLAVFRKITVYSATDLASCSKLASEFRFGAKYVIKNKVMHIPNSIVGKKYFIKLSEEERRNYYDEFKIHRGQLIIGHVGYFGFQKNHIFMMKLIERMVERNIDFVWLFVGTGRNFGVTVSEAKRLNINSYIRFLGRRNDVNRLYQIMDVSILPSIFEGLPTVTIETQAAGTPTVISENVSDEVDMGFKMVRRISLTASLDEWINAIIESSQMVIPDQEVRQKSMEKKCFISNRAVELYYRFINGEIKTYNLGDKVDW